MDIVNKYVAYYRVSTDRQGKSGLGLDAQKDAIHRFIESSHGNIETEFTEIESGKTHNRPELIKAIEHCKKHKTILLIAKLDRLSRNLHFITGLMEAKIDFVAADNPHANKLMVHLLAAFAEHEREMISHRTKQALASAKARGVKLGTYGKTLAQKNKRDADNFARNLLPVITDMKDNGITSVRKICEELNTRNIRTSRNNPWSVDTTFRLLKRIDGLV